MKSIVKVLLMTFNLLGFVILALFATQGELDKTLGFSLFGFNVFLSLILFTQSKKELAGFVQKLRHYSIVDRAFNLFLLFCALGLINFLAFKHPLQLDFSRGKENTLTAQTQAILDSLEHPLKMTVISQAQYKAQVLALVDLYRIEKSDVTIDYIDIDKRPDLAKRYQLTTLANVLIHYDGKEALAKETSELAITNALIKVSSQKENIIYYTQGHGEKDFDSSKEDGLDFFKKQLQAQSIILKPLSLIEVNKIPTNTHTLMIWGPTKGFLDSEIKTLKKFLDDGGNLITALDPLMGEDQIKNLRKLYQDFGFSIPNQLVVDSISNVNGSNGSIPVVKKFNQTHIITKSMQGQVFFPFAAPVIESKLSSDSFKFYDLAHSSLFPASWAENDQKQISSGKVVFNSQQDVRGPVSFVAALEREQKNKEQKIMAFGNSTFVLNGYKNMTDNFMLAINSISWVVGDNRLISFNLPQLADPAVVLTQFQSNTIFAFSLLFVPVAMLGMAIAIYRQRMRG